MIATNRADEEVDHCIACLENTCSAECEAKCEQEDNIQECNNCVKQLCATCFEGPDPSCQQVSSRSYS